MIFLCDIASRYKHCSTVTDSGIGLEKFNFRGGLSCKMSGNSAKKSVNWHAGWLGERDANWDLVGDWARKSNAAYKEDLRKAEEEEKARLATRKREKEDAARKKQPRPTLRSGRRRCKLFRGNQGQERVHRGTEQHLEDSSCKR